MARLASNFAFTLSIASGFMGPSVPAAAQEISVATATSTTGDATSAVRDGQHDFDFMAGTWDAELKRLDRPLSGSNRWIEFKGVQITRKVWDGRANLDEFYVDSAELKIEGLTLRLYNPNTHEWNLYWANARRGLVDPPVVGRWRAGRGEFYGDDTHEGKSIRVRYVWSDVTADSARFEQSFSIDGGGTWEPNWICRLKRRKE